MLLAFTGLVIRVALACAMASITRRATAVTRICLMMDVLVRVGAADRRVVDIRGFEPEQLGFAMIDPDVA